jgi:hypothetical protein
MANQLLQERITEITSLANVKAAVANIERLVNEPGKRYGKSRRARRDEWEHLLGLASGAFQFLANRHESLVIEANAKANAKEDANEAA